MWVSAKQPFTAALPPPRNGSESQTQGVGRFLVGEGQEELHFNHGNAFRMHAGKLVERLVNRQGERDLRFVEGRIGRSNPRRYQGRLDVDLSDPCCAPGR
jgi:hypothetical protein